MKSFAVVFLLSSLFLQPTFAAPAPVVTVNPASLRGMLLKNNMGILQQLNLVHQAKDQVMIARGNLLPKLNLGAIISGVASGPSFALSAVSFLLPFLLPSNWANLHQSEYLLEAQKVGYRLVGLNVFASAYTLYSAMLSDLAIRDVLAAEKEDLVTVRDWLEKQRRYLGNVSQVDVDRADSEVKLAEANISAMDELLIRERAALREMLALDLDAKIILEPHHTPGFPAEDLTIPQLAGKIQAVAPENLQISFLEKAAEEARWGKSFGFLSGAGLNVGSSGSVSFSKLAGSAQFSIGFDYVPGIQLASDNIETNQDKIMTYIKNLKEYNASVQEKHNNKLD